METPDKLGGLLHLSSMQTRRIVAMVPLLCLNISMHIVPETVEFIETHRPC